MPPAPLPSFEEARLKSLKSLGLLGSPRLPDLDKLVRVAAKMMDTPIAALTLITETKQWFMSSYGLSDSNEISRDLSFCAYTLLEPNIILVIPDATQDDRFSDNRQVTEKPGIRSYVGISISSKDDLPIGTLCVVDLKPRTFSSLELSNFRNLARAVTNNIRLHGVVHCLQQKH